MQDPNNQSKMLDPWNPTAEEIQAWAYSTDDMPDEDWYLALTIETHRKLILELACDEKWLKRDFFVKVLYSIVGQVFHEKQGPRGMKLLTDFVNSDLIIAPDDVKLWQAKALRLLAHPESYVYEEWF